MATRESTPLDDAELLLLNVEREIKELKDMYESKQSERTISNHVWMTDKIENNVKKHVLFLIEAVSKIRENHVGDFKTSTNFDLALRYCNDINKILNDMITMYKMRFGYMDIKLKLQYAMPQLSQNLTHLRNRFGIIKGQITRKRFEYEEDSWF